MPLGAAHGILYRSSLTILFAGHRMRPESFSAPYIDDHTPPPAARADSAHRSHRHRDRRVSLHRGLVVVRRLLHDSHHDDHDRLGRTSPTIARGPHLQFVHDRRGGARGGLRDCDLLADVARIRIRQGLRPPPHGTRTRKTFRTLHHLRRGPRRADGCAPASRERRNVRGDRPRSQPRALGGRRKDSGHRGQRVERGYPAEGAHRHGAGSSRPSARTPKICTSCLPRADSVPT